MILDENERSQPTASCRMVVADGHGDNINGGDDDEDDGDRQLATETLVLVCDSTKRKLRRSNGLKMPDYSRIPPQGRGADSNNTCHHRTIIGLDEIGGGDGDDEQQVKDNEAISDGLLVVVDVESTGSDSPCSRGDSSGDGGSKGSPPSSSASTINCIGGQKIKSSTSSSASGSPSQGSPPQVDLELGNKCGKCQNHEIEISKKGHARDCPFKKCDCRKCRLLDARSDILQVISGKETKLKGTKKDPNCGFCQNHGIKILRKGHVRSCGFGQERHFKLNNCFDCEVHYIRNEVNRLQIKMRRAMKEDRTLSEEQRKTAREAITRDEVEKVCDMARLARKKRENMLTQQAGESSAPAQMQANSNNPAASGGGLLDSTASASPSNMPIVVPKVEHPISAGTNASRHHHHNSNNNNNHHQLNQLVARQTGVWRPWSQHQVAAAMAAQQHLANSNNHTPTSTNSHHNHHHHHHHDQYHQLPMAPPPQQSNHQNRRHQGSSSNQQQQANIMGDGGSQVTAISLQQQQQQQQPHYNHHHHQAPPLPQANNNINDQQQQQQLTSAITSMAMANQTYLMNSLQATSAQQQQQQQQQANSRAILGIQLQPLDEQPHVMHEDQQLLEPGNQSSFNNGQFSPPSTPPPPGPANNQAMVEQPLQLTAQRSFQEQQLFNTLFRLIVAQFAGAAQSPLGGN